MILFNSNPAPYHQASREGEDVFSLLKKSHVLDEQLDIVTNGGAVVSLNLLCRPEQGRKMSMDNKGNVLATDVRVEAENTSAKKLSLSFDSDVITYKDEPNAYYMDLVPIYKIYNYIEYEQHGTQSYEFYNPDRERGNMVDEYTKYVFDHFCNTTQSCFAMIADLDKQYKMAHQDKNIILETKTLSRIDTIKHELTQYYGKIAASPDIDKIAFGQQMRKIPNSTPWMSLAMENETMQDMIMATSPRLADPQIDKEPERHKHKDKHEIEVTL